MTLLPPVHLAFGYTDMRKGIDGLAILVQEVLRQDPFTGHLFVFRGRKANLLKIVSTRSGHIRAYWRRTVVHPPRSQPSGRRLFPSGR
jgi:transposase